MRAGSSPVSRTNISEYSAAWLAHLLWEQRVVGSNPTTPTNQKGLIKKSRRQRLASCRVRVSSILWKSVLACCILRSNLDCI